jgi:hypothetical protein
VGISCRKKKRFEIEDFWPGFSAFEIKLLGEQAALI